MLEKNGFGGVGGLSGGEGPGVQYENGQIGGCGGRAMRGAKQLQILSSSVPPIWQCKKLLNPGEYGVFAARAGERRCWHRPCFSCQACGQALINLIYFYHDGHLYCGRHHAELLRPRCPACDQVVAQQKEALGEFFPGGRSTGTGNSFLGCSSSSELGTSQGHPIPCCSLGLWACGTCCLYLSALSPSASRGP